MTAVEATEPATGHPLDNPVWASLSGPHRHLAQGDGAKALRYPADLSPFMAVSAFDDPQAWAQLAELAGPGGVITTAGPANLLDLVPSDWGVELNLTGVQLVATDALLSGPDPETVRLGAGDVDEMLDLVARTRPGPFERRTVELGTYLGIRREGALVAMAGERMRPAGYTEISAVCTDPAFRGQGLAGRLVRAVAHVIRERGDVPMLHTAAGNERAIRLYEALGFTIRWSPTFYDLRIPQG